MSFNFPCYDRAHLAASHEELNLANNLPSDIPDAALFMTSTTCVPSIDVTVHKPFYNATPPVKLLPVGARPSNSTKATSLTDFGTAAGENIMFAVISPS